VACVFPFRLNANGPQFEECTTARSGLPLYHWCATSVDSAGKYASWGRCRRNTGKECPGFVEEEEDDEDEDVMDEEEEENVEEDVDDEAVVIPGPPIQ